MKMLAVHLVTRLGRVLTSPASVATLILTGLATLVLWPIPGRSQAVDMHPVMVLPLIMWAWLLPVPACQMVAGRVANRRGFSAFGAGANPTLPIGALARAAAEMILVGGWLLAVRVAAYPLLSGTVFVDFPGVGSPQSLLGHLAMSVAGLLVMLPFALAWLSPAGSLDQMWLRAGLPAIVYLICVVTGLEDSRLGWTVMVCSLWVVSLSLFGRELPRPGADVVRRLPIGRLVRPALSPMAQLRRDQLLRPLRTAVPLMLLGAVAAVLGGAGILEESALSFVVGASTGLFFALVALRPLGSNVILESMTGKHGFGAGDFVTAWSVLPVRRRPVVLGVFAHGLVVGVASGALLLLLRVLWLWLESGHADPASALGGGFARLALFPMVLAPPLASFLTCAAVGKTKTAFLCLAGMILVFLGWFPAYEELGPGSAASVFAPVLAVALVPGLWCVRNQGGTPRASG